MLTFTANLDGADLSGANLSGVNFKGMKKLGFDLTVCTISLTTKISKYTGWEKGVNGFYCSEKDISVLIRLDPKGNSMRGSNPDAVEDSLKHARKLHFYSIMLAGIALLVFILDIKEIKIPYLLPDNVLGKVSNPTVSPFKLSVLSIILSTGICGLVAVFLNSALQGTQYLNDRASAMKIGHFPWVLSKYEHKKGSKIISFIFRLLFSFHPVIYIPFFFSKRINDSMFFSLLIPWSRYYILPSSNFIIIGILLLIICGRIFYLSERFQKPILFDPKTEKDRKNDTERLTERVSELIDSLKERI